jgi:hypothetical protein
MVTLIDALLARRMLERALAPATKPTLAVTDIDDLMTMAASTDANGNTVYTDAKLNAAAARGWSWKAGLTSDQYDLGGGSGIKLDRSQWNKHCREMAAEYRNGTMSVAGEPRRGGGFGTIAVTTPLTEVTT